MWSGYVKNLRKDGGFYWVYAQVSSLLDKNENLIGYKSLRAPVESTKRHELEVNYTRLKEMEENVIKLSEWIDCETFRQLETLSHQQNRSISEILKEMVD